jgi:hypothetical protein
MVAGGTATIAGLDGELQNHGLTIGFLSLKQTKKGTNVISGNCEKRAGIRKPEKLIQRLRAFLKNRMR